MALDDLIELRFGGLERGRVLGRLQDGGRFLDQIELFPHQLVAGAGVAAAATGPAPQHADHHAAHQPCRERFHGRPPVQWMVTSSCTWSLLFCCVPAAPFPAPKENIPRYRIRIEHSLPPRRLSSSGSSRQRYATPETAIAERAYGQDELAARSSASGDVLRHAHASDTDT